MVRLIAVKASAGNLSAENAGVCAERRLIKRIRMVALKKGVSFHSISTWFYRTFGRIKVTRCLADGTYGCSMPCVCCAKALGRYNLRWEATSLCGTVCKDNDPLRPKAKPTRSMATILNWK
jgi:hypothetical protein